MSALIQREAGVHARRIELARDFHYKGYTVEAGKLVAVSPAVSNRLPDYFPEPDRFDPDRYGQDRREDARNPWTWIPFGGGRHKCIGSAFAMMQLRDRDPSTRI